MTNPIHLLREMIAIPSVNPMRFDTSEPVERGMVDFIESVLRRAGIDCRRQTVAEGRDNVIGVVQPTTNGRTNHRGGIMFNSHMDTVPVENMTIDPFDPIVKEGRVFGRGSCDAKASIAAMLCAVVNYASLPQRRSEVVFATMADEEFSFSGSWKLIEKDLPVSACVIGEPTRLRTVIAHKGVVRWRIKVAGISAHGATPERGQSAIYDGARLALALEEYARRLAGEGSHPLLDHATLNVGKVFGGQSVNIVPDHCEFEIERRLLPGEDGHRAVADCEGFIRERVGNQIQFAMEEPYLMDPALDTMADAAVVSVLTAAQQAEGVETSLEGANYCTDGSKLASIGIPTVVCGPGDIAQAHTSAEFVDIEQVELATRLYGSVLENWTRRV